MVERVSDETLVRILDFINDAVDGEAPGQTENMIATKEVELFARLAANLIRNIVIAKSEVEGLTARERTRFRNDFLTRFNQMVRVMVES